MKFICIICTPHFADAEPAVRPGPAISDPASVLSWAPAKAPPDPSHALPAHAVAGGAGETLHWSEINCNVGGHLDSQASLALFKGLYVGAFGPVDELCIYSP